MQEKYFVQFHIQFGHFPCRAAFGWLLMEFVCSCDQSQTFCQVESKIILFQQVAWAALAYWETTSPVSINWWLQICQRFVFYSDVRYTAKSRQLERSSKFRRSIPLAGHSLPQRRISVRGYFDRSSVAHRLSQLYPKLEVLIDLVYRIEN